METFSTRTYSSTYIKKSSLPADDVKTIEADIRLFNNMLHVAVSDFNKSHDPTEASLHVRLKRDYECTDYFVTSVQAAQQGNLKSAKECLELRIEAQQEKISQMEKKIKKLESSRDKMLKVKDNLKERSIARKNNARVPAFKKVFGGWISTKKAKDKTLQFVVGLPSKGKKKSKQTVYANEYLFEHDFVDPYIRKKKAMIGQIQGRLNNAKELLARLKDKQKQQKYSICFGSRKLFREQNKFIAMENAKGENRTEPLSPEKAKAIEENKVLQKAAFQRKRNVPMLLAGRYDAAQGNFLVKYDTGTNELTYRAATAKKEIVLPKVVFSYGQDNINMAVDSHKLNVDNKKLPPDKQIPCWPRKPVSWTIQDCGNAFLVKCIVTEPDPDVNYCYSHGCVSIDMNYEHLAVAETNDYGQLVWCKIVPFKMFKRTSGQIENAISEALEVVFQHAAAVGKPVAMENIKKIKKVNVYGNRKRNRKISQFAYQTMQELAESKARKYKLALKKVNPAYTSQIGKIKYMRALGTSIHVSAAYAIGRRAMKCKEKIPKAISPCLPQNNKPKWMARWAALSKGLKGIDTHCFYKKVNCKGINTLVELKEALTA